ncbi:MAG: DUF4928 family protein [Verrucomicrobia bacterium]|nr:DUF4928 family protein [Verrucomicrobiota bacterium]
MTQRAKVSGLPLKKEDLRTKRQGQVAGLGKGPVQKILAGFEINKVLAEEGGRTSRGSMGLMEAYVDELNKLYETGDLDLDAAFAWWIERVKAHFAAEGPKFRFDRGKSLGVNIGELLNQAQVLQSEGGGTNYVGAMLQHLVGAKLAQVLGPNAISHHGFSVADHSTGRRGDFEVQSVAVHVTTHPSEALVRKCCENLSDGLKPVIVTLPEGVPVALGLLKNQGVSDRVDVLDAVQFLTANVLERSLLAAVERQDSLRAIIERYNAIVESCEADPSLLIRIPD